MRERELRTSERVEEEEEEEERRESRVSLSLFFFYSAFSFCVIFLTNTKHTNALRKERKKRKKEKHTSIMDESWEELKRNAILLGSWIALIRASTYIFGAFQKAD